MMTSNAVSRNAVTPPDPKEMLDVSGMQCPLPVLRAQKALRNKQSDEVLLLISTDAVSDDEVPLFCEQTGHRLLHHEVSEGKRRFWIARRPWREG